MPGVRFTFTGPTDERDFGESANITLFRMVQEGLTNAAKHARARHVDIALESRFDAALRREEALLTVLDDGVGARESSDRTGVGVFRRRERVQALGGSFKAGPITGGGFELVARIPLAREHS